MRDAFHTVDRAHNSGAGKRRTAAGIDPAEILRGPWAQHYAIGLRVPDVDYAHRGDGEQRQAQLWDDEGTSVTIVNYGRWWEPTAVTSRGPRDLWAEVRAAYSDRRLVGQPDPTRHGLTVTSDGAQQAWLDTPNGRTWTFPA